MNTLSYIRGSEEEIKVGGEYYFGQLWNGNGDVEELLESGAIAVWDSVEEVEYIIDFDVVESDENLMDTIVKVNCIR